MIRPRAGFRSDVDHPTCAPQRSNLETTWEPIVDLASDAVVGHASGPPPQTGRWATAAAAAVAAGPLDADRGAPAIHVGVLPSDLRRPYLIASIGRLEPTLRSRIVFDITGPEQLRPASGAEGAVVALRRLGVRFAIDAVDGWSNLRAIELVRPEVVRLARRPIGPGGDQTARWVVELARSIAATSLVSDIGGEDDLVWAAEMGFEQGQGTRWSTG